MFPHKIGVIFQILKVLAAKPFISFFAYFLRRPKTRKKSLLEKIFQTYYGPHTKVCQNYPFPTIKSVFPVSLSSWTKHCI